MLIAELNLEGFETAAWLGELRARSPGVPVLIYTGCQRPELVAAALHGQPDGMVHKEETMATSWAAVAAVAGGGHYTSRTITSLGVRGQAVGADAGLSGRERAVWKLVAEGRPSKAIAAALGLSEKAVERTRAELGRKLAAPDLASLVRLAVRHGLVE